MKLRNFIDFDIRKKNVLVRVDFNVPIKNGIITDGFRIDQSMDTINKLLENECKVILISHMGDPKGNYDQALSLKPVAEYLANKINKKLFFFFFTPDCIGNNTKEIILHAKYGDIVLLENLRFHIEEEQNNQEFAKILASYADVYVNDAFSCSHRKHASINALSQLIASFAGCLLTKEISLIDQYVNNAKKPLAGILGGAKISTKFKLIKSLLNKVDVLFIAGAMANNFLKENNIDIGNSFYEQGFENETKEIKKIALAKNIPIILPIDFAVASNIDGEASQYFNAGENIGNQSIYDIGPKTINLFFSHIAKVSSVLWNGPVGAFENPLFNQGTFMIARAIAEASANFGLISIAGGGDTAFSINQAGASEHFTFISTGGGAFLSYIENNQLTGLEKTKKIFFTR